MRLIGRICLGAVAVSAAKCSGATGGCIPYELVQELPLPIRAPAENIRQMLLEHPYLQETMKGGCQDFGDEETQVLHEFLSHVSKVVKHILLHPEGEPETSPADMAAPLFTAVVEDNGPTCNFTLVLPNQTAPGPKPASFEALTPSFKLLTIIFSLPIEFEPEYRLNYEECHYSGLRLEPTSLSALVPLRLAEGQAQTLRWFSCIAVGGRTMESVGRLPFTILLDKPWLGLALDTVLAVQPIVELCSEDWPKVLRAVGSASKKEFLFLQSQVEQHIQVASEAFFAARDLIAEQRKQGSHEDHPRLGSSWLIHWAAFTLPGRKGFLEQTIGPRKGQWSWPQVKQFRLSITKFLVELAAQTIRLGRLVPGTLSPLPRIPATLLTQQQALSSVSSSLEGLGDFKNSLREAEMNLQESGSLGPLKKVLGTLSNLQPMTANVYMLQDVADDTLGLLEPGRTQILTKLGVILADIVRVLDQAIEWCSDKPDELQRYELLASILLPPVRENLLGHFGPVRHCELFAICSVMEILRVVQEHIGVSEGCNYDLSRFSLIEIFYPTPRATKSANFHDTAKNEEAIPSILGPRSNLERNSPGPSRKRQKKV